MCLEKTGKSGKFKSYFLDMKYQGILLFYLKSQWKIIGFLWLLSAYFLFLLKSLVHTCRLLHCKLIKLLKYIREFESFHQTIIGENHFMVAAWSLCMYVLHVNVCVCMYECMYVWVHVYLYVYTCVYVID